MSQHASDVAILSALRVLEQEIQGIQALVQVIDQRFSEAIELILGCKGKIIVSGMGKSGHIARKIAATFASTGTPAFFVHPGEASHGDLGMISKNDIVMLLSNSGETIELKDIIRYSKRMGIPIIAMVRRKQSALVQAASIAFILPDSPEASHVNAPTTSTTMMLVLGDAMAIALLERKGFSKEDFHLFHPGGKLGASFTKVIDIMHRGETLPLISENAIMAEAILEITVKRLGCVGVINAEQKLIGIITDGDLRRHMGQEFIQVTTKEVMTPNPVTVSSHALIEEAIHIMQRKTITVLFVCNAAGVPEGVIHIHDCLKA